MQKNSNQNVIAIYSRKSHFTDKGKSIGNQVELCRSYIRTTFGDEYAEKAIVYEDEGFSDGDLNRPGFKRMMKAARQLKLSCLCPAVRPQRALPAGVGKRGEGYQ